MLFSQYFQGIFLFVCAIFSINAQIPSSRLESLKSSIDSNFDKFNDFEKKEAAEFLVNHMDIHTSIECNWFDSADQPIAYDELSFEDYLAAKNQFEAIKKDGGHHKLDTVYDMTRITDDYLIKNTEKAYNAWKTNTWSQSYSFDIFKEYILPYRVSTEPLQDWRDDYKWYYDAIKQDNKAETDPVEICKKVLLANTAFQFKLFRDDPLPLLGPKNILFRNHGNCADIANLNIFALRSLGVAITFDFTPHWGASSNRHMWNTVIDKSGKHLPFDNENLVYNTHKRFAKVFRYTYSEQKQSMASQYKKKEIPNSFLRKKNIVDVTNEYASTGSITHTFKTKGVGPSFIGVYNKGYWHITDWSTTNTEGTSEFKNLGRNIVYLPLLERGNLVELAEAPVLLTDEGETKVLEPNLQDTFDCTLSNENQTKIWVNEENSTKIEDQQEYKLIYWYNGGWTQHATTKANGERISFKNVPKNALFLLLTSEVDNFERPFLIDPRNNEIIWY